jgi:hypothetical protein
MGFLVTLQRFRKKLSRSPVDFARAKELLIQKDLCTGRDVAFRDGFRPRDRLLFLRLRLRKRQENSREYWPEKLVHTVT